MEKQNKKLVIFDFDGVLVDTLFVGHSVTEEVNKDISVDDYRALFEGNIYESVGFKINSHPNFFERYDYYARDVKIPDELKNILKKLKEKYNLVIVSSSDTKSIQKILSRENSLELFDLILGSNINSNKVIKIKMVLEKYRINPEESVFITDTLGDILEARKCNVKSIAVTWGFHEKERLLKGKPFVIIDDPKDLFSCIQNVLK